MVGATGVEGSLAVWASVVASQIAVDGEQLVAITAQNGFGIALSFGPDGGWVVGGFAVALDAGVELLAAGMLDGDDVERGMVVLALGAGGYGGAVAGGRVRFAQDCCHAWFLLRKSRICKMVITAASSTL